MKARMLALIVTILLINGCQTAYKPLGFSGGYQEVRVSESEYVVSFSGNGMTSVITVENGLLRRCAEIAVRDGYRYFFIDGHQVNNSQSAVTTAPQLTSQTNYRSTGPDTVTASTTYDYRPEQVDVYNHYTASGKLVMFKEKQQGIKLLDAQIISENFANK